MYIAPSNFESGSNFVSKAFTAAYLLYFVTCQHTGLAKQLGETMLAFIKDRCCPVGEVKLTHSISSKVYIKTTKPTWLLSFSNRNCVSYNRIVLIIYA
jgi:hypothetical protein